jgi:hypothetical protein
VAGLVPGQGRIVKGSVLSCPKSVPFRFAFTLAKQSGIGMQKDGNTSVEASEDVDPKALNETLDCEQTGKGFWNALVATLEEPAKKETAHEGTGQANDDGPSLG